MGGERWSKGVSLTMKIIMSMVMMFVSSIDSMNSVYPFGDVSDVTRSNRARQEFVLSINFSDNTMHGDKDMSSYRESLDVSSRALAFDTRQLPSQLQGMVEREEQVDVHHEINKSNQGNTNSFIGSATSPSTLSYGSSEFADSLKMPISPLDISAYFERVELLESQMPTSKDNLLLHHRHKRYLVFPEGTSLQLSFDLIIPVVDYTNYAIMGITCAVAWELPSKPPSEIIENFRHKLNDGTFGLIRRIGSVQNQQQQEPSAITGHRGNVKSLPEHAVNEEMLSGAAATTFAHYMPTSPSSVDYSNMRHFDHYNDQQSRDDDVSSLGKLDDNRQRWESFHAGLNGWSMQPNLGKEFLQKFTEANYRPLSWWERSDGGTQKQRPHNSKTWSSSEALKRPPMKRKILRKRPKHLIAPIFGKRRKSSYATTTLDHQLPHNEDWSEDLNEIKTREHVRTRHKLYSKIEKLYKTRGHNGTACVLRTLCETHKEQQKHRLANGQQTPRSFVMELLRAIFTLPQDTLKSSASLHNNGSAYMEAAKHALHMPLCRQHYHGCEYPIWNDAEI